MQIEGRNPLIESLRAAQPINVIYLQKGLPKNEKISEIIKRAKQDKIQIKNVSKAFLNKISKTGIHQGVIGMRKKKFKETIDEVMDIIASQGKEPFFVYIREAQNEYNIGSIIRTAEIAGAQAIILPTQTELSEQMVRAAMGASEHMYIFNQSLFQTIKLMHKEGVKVVGIERGGDDYHRIDLTGPIMLIIGGEDKSLSEEVLNKCDAVASLPMFGKVNSLNMANAASIVIYEKVRQGLVIKN